MNFEQYCELWEIRFRKIEDLEKDSLKFYRNILKKFDSLLKQSQSKDIIEGILKDEAKHLLIARELIEVVKRKKAKH